MSDVNKLGMIAFGKVKQLKVSLDTLEKRIKLIEDYIQSQTSAQEVRNNRGTV